jgi:hypothetical protein
MLTRGLTAAISCLPLSTLCAPAQAQDQYCDLAAPPANASLDANHGHYFFMFPDALPEKFTGCKTWWIDTGEKYFIFRLKDGRVTEMNMLGNQADQAPGSPQYATCLYPNGALVNDASADCLDFEEAQSLAEYASGTEGGPKVPPAKDIRTKTPLE